MKKASNSHAEKTKKLHHDILKDHIKLMKSHSKLEKHLNKKGK